MMRRHIRQIFHNDDAGTMAMTAVMLPMILGFSGLGLDLTGWYMDRRDIQNLVDMAAVEAVHTGNYYDNEALEAQVSQFMATYGLDADRDTMTISDPPTGGAYAGRNGFFEVLIERRVILNFVSAFYGMTGEDFAVQASARAVAGTLVIGKQCIVALDETANRALDFSGTADVVAECGVASNSTSNESIYVGGHASLTADPAMAVGDIAVSGSATLTTNSPLQTFAAPVSDPYSDLTIPPLSACDFVGTTSVGNDAVMTPGRYCGDLSVQGDDIIFEPGTYIIDGGDFTSNAGSNFTGEGVTFILTGATAFDVGTVTMNGGTTADLSAPAAGEDYEGILFYQDPKADYRGSRARFNGGVNLLLDGVVYFPSTDITFTGGASADPACTQIFAATVAFTGSSIVGNDDPTCEALNMMISPQVRVQLVE